MNAHRAESYCRLCGEFNLTPCLNLPHSPRSISRLLRYEDISTDTAIDLSVFECNSCGFVQLIQTLDASFYDDYLMTVSHSKQMNAYQQAQATEFVRRFNLTGKRVIEIGCGDGNYLRHLHEAGAIPYGIEPSARFLKLARQWGFPIWQGYVGRQSRVPEAPYAAFVARQVLEHVPDPNDFLQGAQQVLTTSGVGLVEVPSLEQSLKNGRFYDFFPDHLNYFSAQTLCYALERNGFEVVELSRGMNGEYLVALVRGGGTTY